MMQYDDVNVITNSKWRTDDILKIVFGNISAPCWNALPVDVISSTTLPAFKQLLKSELFSRSFPDAWYSSSCTWLLELFERLSSWHCNVVL